MLPQFISFFSTPDVSYILQVLYYSAFFWVPIILVLGLWELWVTYVRARWRAKQTYVLLEIKVPRDVFKSPKAMEFFVNGLFKTDNEQSWWHIHLRGETRPDFSLEIVSIDGNVHFYVRTRKWLQPPIESNLYSQYPGIEIFEVPDYTLPVRYDPEVQGLWGAEFALRKEDVFPIKTYIDFGMDKDPKEEFKIDPITPFIEYIGQWGRGHQMWLQIILRAHKAETKDPKTGKMVDLRFEKDAAVQVEKILKNAKGEIGPDGKIVAGTGRFLTEVEQESIKAIERKVSKNAYDVGMRFIYTAPKDVFVTSNLTGAVGALMNFSSGNLNGFKPARATGGKYASALYDFWPFKNKKKKDVDAEKRKMLDAYKHRAYFYNEFRQPHFILNSEELASIFHFPGGVSTTPTYERIQSTKAEAPANIPV